MALSNTDLVTELYIGYYNRAPDPTGLQFWLNALNTGSSLTQVADAFSRSSESTAIYPYLTLPGVVTPDSFINQVYQNILNRAPDTAGFNFWKAQLTPDPVTGKINVTAGQFIVTLEASVNMQVGTNDAITLNNKIIVGEDYVGKVAASNTPYTPASAKGALAPVSVTSPSTDAQVATAKAFDDAYVAGVSNNGQVFTLTAGVDSFTGGSGNDIFNAGPVVGSTNTTAASFTALDSLNGGLGNDTLNIVDTTAAFAVPASVSVSNIETTNVTSTGTVTGDFSTFTGLTALNVQEFGGTTAGGIKAATTTAVVLTDSKAAASTISVQGGSAVTVTANGVTTGGTINVGTTSAPVGAVVVTTNESATAVTTAGTVFTADAINVKGGTTVAITANLNSGAAFAGSAVTGGAIGVTGTASTTTVTVNQSATTIGSAATLAVTGVAAVTGATAAPGVNGVTGVTAVAPVAAKAAVSGVVDGAVTIADANTNAGANTIAAVSLSNYGIGSSITSNALNTLSLSGTAGTLALGRTAANSSNALALSLTGLSAPSIVGTVVNSATGGDNTITDTFNEIATLNVTTATADSKLTAFADTGLKTLNIAGTNVLSLGTVNASLTSIAVSGAAGFSGDISGVGAALALTTTSSGKITATLDSTTQTFVGSTGQDVITIIADATKVITGGSGTNDEIVLNGNATAFTASKTGKNVTGFETIGVANLSQGTFDVSLFGGSAIKTLDVLTDVAAATNFTKVTAGTALTIGATTTSALGYQVSDAAGASDSVSVTIGAAANKAAITVNSLTLQDANNVGIGTLNLVSNNSAFGGINTITTLVDNGLSTLNVTGNAGLTIGTLTEATTQATSFTINNTETGAAGVTISAFTDANLGSLTFTGSNASTISDLIGLTGKVLTIANTGTSTATITVFESDASLQTLTLNGNVAIGTNSTTANPNAQGGATGLTISGATDNAHVNITVAGAGAGVVDSITLGNGNNLITDNSTAGTVNVIVGTGFNLIDVHTGTASTFGSSVTLGAHTDSATLFDQVNVSVVNGQASSFSTSITGVAAGDHVVFTDATATTVLTLTTAQQNTITAQANLAGAVTTAFANSTAAHQAIAFQYGGDTYVIDNVGADTALTAGTDSIVKLVGVHTISASATVGHIVVAS